MNNCEGSHENAVHNMPELYKHHCQRRVQWTVCLGPRARPGNVHTGILFDDGRIVEIYHLLQASDLDEGGIWRRDFRICRFACAALYRGEGICICSLPCKATINMTKEKTAKTKT